MDAQTRTQQFRLGLFVVASLAALGGLAFLFGGSPAFLSNRHPYVLTFDDAPGVGIGTPVRRSGVKIGEVSKVDLDDATGRVRVGILVDKKYTLRTTEEPFINQGLLSGDTSIDFIPKKDVGGTRPAPSRGGAAIKEPPNEQQEPPQPPPPGNTAVPPGSEIRGRNPTDARTLLNQASDVLPSAQQSLNQIRRSVERFDALTPRAEDALRELTDLGRALRETVPELRRSNDDVRAVLSFVKLLGPTLNQAAAEATATLRTWNTAGEQVNQILRDNRPKVNDIVDQATQATKQLNDLLGEENRRNVRSTLDSAAKASKQLETTAQTADAAIREANATVVEARATVKRLQDTLNNFDTVLGNVDKTVKPFADRAPSIAQNLDSAVQSADRTFRSTGDLLGPLGKGADGSLNRLLNDPAIFNNLNTASGMVVQILPRLDRVLYNLEVFADKIARHPEQIGVGGAIRPSQGLKESPAAGPTPGTVTPYRPRP